MFQTLYLNWAKALTSTLNLAQKKVDGEQAALVIGVIGPWKSDEFMTDKMDTALTN